MVIKADLRQLHLKGGEEWCRILQVQGGVQSHCSMKRRDNVAHRLILIQDSVRFDGWYAAPASRRFSMSPSVPPANASRRNSCTCI